MSSRATGLLLTAIGVLVLSPDALTMRIVEADVWALVLWRNLFMAIGVTLGLAVVYRGRTYSHVRAIGRSGLAAGILFGGSSIFFVGSIMLTDVANTLVIISTTPMLAAVFSHIFLGERSRRATWVAVIAVCGGLAIVLANGFDRGNFTGDIYGLIAAVFMAVNLVVVRRASQRSMIPSVAIGGFMVALIAVPFAGPLGVDTVGVGWFAAFNLVLLPIAFGLITTGPRYISAPEVGLVMLIESCLGSFWVWLVLDEIPTSTTFLGGGIILGVLAIHSIVTLKMQRV
ncbi:MAG: DMT family transporter [Alphaproteobacteria bacterium]|nr:DMT family transporter [Alphaproteobacteria bacterium]